MTRRPTSSNLRFPPIYILVALAAVAALCVFAGEAAAVWPTDPMIGLNVSFTPGHDTDVQAISDGDGGAIMVWASNPEHPDLQDVEFYNANVGIAVGDNGTVLTTTDGGDNWVSQNSGTALTLHHVDMLSTSVATAVGENGTILRSTNGGVDWSAQTSGTSATLRSVSFWSSSYGMAVGDAGTMLRTLNGGTTWTSVSVTIENMYGVCAISSTTFCAVGDGPTVLRTTNNGGSWISQVPVTPYDMRAVDFYDANNGMAAGRSGVVIMTTNGGTTWIPSYTTYDYYDYEAIDMVSTTQAIAAGYYTAMTTNGGASWSTQYAAGYRNTGVSFVSSTTGTAVGRNGTINRAVDALSNIWVTQSEASNIVAQRVSQDGDLLWGPGGVTVCAADGAQQYPQLTSDGAGGAVIVWRDDRHPGYDARFYAQKVDASGLPLWTTDGVVLEDTTGTAMSERAICTDGSGGAYVAFERNNDIYVQRLYGNGTTWGARGVGVCIEPASQSNPAPVYTHDNTLMVFWQDYRNSNWDIYRGRIDGDGNLLMGQTGYSTATSTDSESNVWPLWSDVAGGVLVVYESYASGSDRIMALLARANGIYWAGVVVRDLPDYSYLEGFVTDGSGGAIIIWEDSRNGVRDLYGNRMDTGGTILWGANGRAIRTGVKNVEEPSVASDGAGGAVVAWMEQIAGCCIWPDILAQRINSSGYRYWQSAGVPIAAAAGGQEYPQVVEGSEGGAIIAWRDSRDSSDREIYCQYVERNGYLGDPSPMLTSVVDSPGDQGGKVVVSWDPSYLDAYPDQIVYRYSLWRRIGPAAVSRPGGARNASGAVAAAEARALAAIAESSERAMAAGYSKEFVQFRAQSGWAYIDEQDAYYLDSYGYEAPTYGDSSASSNPTTEFQVMAHSGNQWVFWTSDPLGGYSVDNLSPSAPLMLSGERSNGDVNLHWQPGTTHYEDLKHYAIYRSDTQGFTPGPSNFVGTEEDTMSTDADPGATMLYYRVAAVDLHDNEGAPSNEIEIPGTPTGIRTPALPVVFTLMPNHPNPFTRSTTLRFGLPSASEVSIDVYDVAGRRVYSDRITRGAGWHTYQFAGVSGGSGKGGYSNGRLPSGVYFYKLNAAGRTETRKMVITR